ncbi:MAG: hypothetical protein MZU91_08355 [Desulfosudis oleivorans]|nr:hypothetical protein [Desulfosudis oleivorans]
MPPRARRARAGLHQARHATDRHGVHAGFIDHDKRAVENIQDYLLDKQDGEALF